MFQIEISDKAERDRDSEELARCIAQKLVPFLRTSPEKTKRLSGPFRKMYSYRFRFQNVPYRVCYTINFESKIVTIYAILPRKEVYRTLSRRVS